VLTILPNYEVIYEEAHMYLYSRPVVCVDTYTLHSFLTIIGAKNRAKLRDVEVAEWGYSAAHKAINFPAVSLLADATKLERFGLNICQWGVSYPNMSCRLVLSSNFGGCLLGRISHCWLMYPRHSGITSS
jgi:hypothetical protein